MNIVKNYCSVSLVLRILIGLAVGVALALLFPEAAFVGVFGNLFVSALKAIAPLLVAVLVISAIAASHEGIGSRFRTVIVLFLTSTVLAALTAVSFSFLFPVSMRLEGVVSTNTPGGLSDVFSNMLTGAVSNPIAALGNGNYLAILFWAVLIGLAIKMTASPKTILAIGELSQAISKVIKWVIQFAPFGIMGLVFKSVTEGGMNIFADYGRIILVLVCCMLFTCLVANPIIVALMIHRNPYPLVLKCLKESGISAFFTRSSAANIPINLDLCRRMGLDEKFYSVTIPLGATVNMNGAATTITVMTLAVCNTLGIQVSFPAAILLCIVAALGACGSSGVAGGSLLLIPMACSLFGISNDIAMQAVGVGFIIGVIQDSLETAINSSGDVIFTATAELREEMILKRKEKKNGA